MVNWRRPLLGFYDARIARSHVPGHLATLDAFHGEPIGTRRRIQAERLSALLRHAARHVPHYRETLRDLGVVGDGPVRLDLFRSIPELTRETLSREFERLRSDDFETRAWYRNSSGGSTGEPVSLLQDRDYEALGMAAIEMHYGWAGRRAGEPMVKLWGSDREALLGTVGWRNKLGGFARNLRLINSFRMTRADMARHVETIRRTRPVLIEAYAESIYELARFMNESGVAISGVRNVVTSAGTLYPFIRKEVEEAFGCPALNRYGSREVGSFAGERTAGGGLEVFAYTHWVEVVDECGRPCGPGQEGDVLVTCLTNRTMPVIRYRIGDRAVVRAATDDPTPSVESLETVTGRSMAAFLREDGSTIPGYFFIHFLGVVHNDGWIRKTQIVQRDYKDVLVRIAARSPPPEGALAEIGRDLGRLIGPDCRVEFEFLDDIPCLPTGKYNYTVCEIPRPRRVA